MKKSILQHRIEIGQKIKNEAKRQGVVIETMAKELKIPKPSIYAVFNGDNATVTNLYKVMNYLGLPLPLENHPTK